MTDTPRRRPLALAMTTAFLAVGLIFLGFGVLEYGIWTDNGPGAGFFPAVFGGGMSVLAIALLVRDRAAAADVRLWNFVPPVAIAVAILAVPVFGMIVAMAIFVCLWFRFVERRGWVRALALGVGTGVAVYLLFGLWLQVSFPDSLLFDRL